MAIEDLGGEFAINRNYNSIGGKLNSVFGYGWAFDYDEFLSMNSDGSIFYKRGDGSFLTLTKGSDGKYYAPAGYEYTLAPQYRSGIINSWKLTDADYTVKTFDTYGMLKSVTDRQGNTTTISYDSNWNISKITSPSGKEYQLSTDSQGRITGIALPNGATLKYTYDSNGNLTTYTNANGHVIRYEYDSNHCMVRWYDANGNCVVDNQYDSKGRVVEQTDAEGNTAQLSYSDGKTVTIDNNGNQTTYYYNENKHTTKIVYPDGSVETKTYNADNYVATETDREGNTTSYTYDDRGNLLTTTRADGAVSYKTYDAKNQLLSETDYNGNKTTYSYDERGNLIQITYADNTVEYYTYDSNNRLTQITDGRGIKQTYTYEGAMPKSYTDGKVDKQEIQNKNVLEQECKELVEDNLLEQYYGKWKVIEYIPLKISNVEQTIWQKEHYYGRTVEITENSYTKSIYYWPDELTSQSVYFDFCEVVDMDSEDIWLTRNAQALQWLDGEYFDVSSIRMLMFYKNGEETPVTYCAVTKDNSHLIDSWLSGEYLLERFDEQEEKITIEDIYGEWEITRLDSYDNIYEGHVKDSKFLPERRTSHLNLTEFYAPDWFGRKVNITSEYLEIDMKMNERVTEIQSRIVNKELFEKEQGIHDGLSLNNEEIQVYQIYYGEAGEVLTVVPVSKDKMIIHIEMGWFVLKK